MRPLQIEIGSEVTRKIRQHARAHMTTEVCGVLIGDQRESVLMISALVEARDAAQAGTHVTFTQDAWEAIYRVKDETYPDERIVGWYHSHPGFGVFLSDQDLFIHRNFFSAPDQVAWVYDPHSDEEGCFCWRDGAIHRVARVTTSRGPEDEAAVAGQQEPQIDRMGEGLEATAAGGDERRPTWFLWVATGLSYVAVLLLGIALSWMFLPHVIGVPVDPLTGQPLLGPPPSGGVMSQPEIQPEGGGR